MELEPNVVDCLFKIADSMNVIAYSLDQISSPELPCEHPKSLTEAVGDLAIAMDKIASKMVGMDELTHAICMGIRKGLFGANAEADVSILEMQT